MMWLHSEDNLQSHERKKETNRWPLLVIKLCSVSASTSVCSSCFPPAVVSCRAQWEWQAFQMSVLTLSFPPTETESLILGFQMRSVQQQKPSELCKVPWSPRACRPSCIFLLHKYPTSRVLEKRHFCFIAPWDKHCDLCSRNNAPQHRWDIWQMHCNNSNRKKKVLECSTGLLNSSCTGK